MRKIIFKKDEAEKRKRNQTMMGLILIFVMFFSVIAYGFVGREDTSEDKKLNYNGFEFVKRDSFWAVNIGEFQFVFKNNPAQVERVSSEVKKLDNYYQKPLYLYSEDDEAGAEIYMNLNQIAKRMQRACLTEEKCEGDLPIKTCEDNFIIIEESEKSEIKQDGNCVFIRGQKNKLSELSDEFLFKVIGIG